MLTFTYLMKTTISEWLAEAINNSGITQAELSRKSGVSAAHITKVLNGERGLGEIALRSIAEALQIPPEQAFRAVGFLPPAPKITEETEEMLYLFDQLKGQDRETVLNMMRFLLSKK